MKKECIIFNLVGVFFILFFCYIGYAIPFLNTTDYISLSLLIIVCLFIMYINNNFNKY